MKHAKLDKIGINLLMINAFIYITFSLYTPYLTSYYSKAGMSALQIGILVTIGPLVAIFIQPLWAILSDRTGKKKHILMFVVLGSAISIFCYYLGNTFLVFFIASFLIAAFSNSIVPLGDAIVLRSAHKHNYDFSKIRLGGTIGYALVVNISGTIVKMNPASQFLLGAIGYIVLLFVLYLLPTGECTEEEIAKPVARKISLRERLNIFHIFESKQIYFLLAFAFISQMGLSFNYNFLGVYMTRLGLNEGAIGFVNSVSAVSEIPVLFLINRILKKTSAMKITVIACFFLTLRILLITGESLEFFVLSNVLHGLSFMTIYYSCATFISKNVKPENQSQGQSILAIVQAGLGSIVGNILGGRLVDAFGLKNAYYSMAALVITSTVIILILALFFMKTDKVKGKVEH